MWRPWKSEKLDLGGSNLGTYYATYGPGNTPPKLEFTQIVKRCDLPSLNGYDEVKDDLHIGKPKKQRKQRKRTGHFETPGEKEIKLHKKGKSKRLDTSQEKLNDCLSVIATPRSLSDTEQDFEVTNGTRVGTIEEGDILQAKTACKLPSFPVREEFTFTRTEEETVTGKISEKFYLPIVTLKNSSVKHVVSYSEPNLKTNNKISAQPKNKQRGTLSMAELSEKVTKRQEELLIDGKKETLQKR